MFKTSSRDFRQQRSREGYLAARYGDEEFAVILSHTDAKGAMRVAESIRSDLKAAGIYHPTSKVNNFVTLSMGVSTAIDAAGLSIEGLIGEADRSLYQAKLEGRDRIFVYLDSKREFQSGKGVFSDDCERS